MNKYIWSFFVAGFILQAISGYQDGSNFRLYLGVSGAAIGIVAIGLELWGIK